MRLPFFASIRAYEGQDYESLKKDCQATGVPFSDPIFPAEDSSLGSGSHLRELPGKVVWKRPRDLCSNPKLFVDGASSCDVKQGSLGNCWLVAASSALAQEKELWNKVIPDHVEQDWNDETPDSYAGIFHFRFWRFGEWIDVVIDDRLPTVNNELVYLHSREKNEFWGPLLEKAYAKVSGTYEALDGGNLSDALVDFSGGVSETINFGEGGFVEDDEKRKTLFKTLVSELTNHSLMCCAIHADNQQEMEQRTDVGLVKGHAYGITAAKKVYIGNTTLKNLFTGREKIYMIRMRNPWGGKEWNGPFSDGSPEWNQITESERERIGLTFDEDGEFWMPFDDFCTHFSDMSVCYMVNTAWFSFGKSWSETSFNGNWVTGERGCKTDRSGGCLNNKESFLRNPQYRFDVEAEQDEIMLYLIQEDKRAQKLEGQENHVIGCHLMKVEENRRYRMHVMKEKAATSDYIKSRAVFLRATLKRGRYVVIPTTFESGTTGDFYLRVFTSKANNGAELTEDVPGKSICPCFTYPCLLTLVTIRGAQGLEKQDRFGSADPYCIIKCERESVRGPIQHDSLDPKWEFSAIFYRKSATSPIKIQIWNSNVVMDSYMGRAVLEAPLNPESVRQDAELFGRRSSRGVKRPGTVNVEIVTTDDLVAY